jgi:hypothetical protein
MKIIKNLAGKFLLVHLIIWLSIGFTYLLSSFILWEWHDVDNQLLRFIEALSFFGSMMAFLVTIDEQNE